MSLLLSSWKVATLTPEGWTSAFGHMQERCNQHAIAISPNAGRACGLRDAGGRAATTTREARDAARRHRRML
jgi:hypothetical protein